MQSIRPAAITLKLAFAAALLTGCETFRDSDYEHEDAPQRRAAASEAPRSGVAVMYLPTGERATSALMVERTVPGEIVAGTEFDYDIVVTNLTDMTLNNVQVIDQPSGSFEFVSAEPEGKSDTGASTWQLGDLGPGQSRRIRVSATAADEGVINSCTYAAFDSALCQSISVVRPTLQITKTMTPANMLACETGTVRIDITNTGTGTARNVRVRDPLPEGMTSEERNAVEIDVGDLAAGQSRAFTFPVRVNKSGEFANKATVTADGNLSAESEQLTVNVTQPVLEASVDCPETLLLGQTGTVTFTVNNTGDGACRDAVLRVDLPSDTTLVGADNEARTGSGAVTWNLGAIEPQASRTVTLQLRASAIGAANIAGTVHCECAEPVTASCNLGLKGSPDLGTLLTDDEGVVVVGNDQAYRCEIENQGQINLTNVVVTVTLPEGMTYVSSSAPAAPTVAGNKLTFSGLSSILRPNEKRSFSLVLRSTTPGEKLVISETTCDELQTPVRDDELTNFVAR